MGVSASGVRVSAERSMQLSSVYACVNIIGKTQASLPFKVYRERLNGAGKDEVPDHPLSKVFYQPNSWQTSFEFVLMMQAHLLLRGNAYAQIVPGPLGFVDQLIPLHPDRVNVYRLENNRIGYGVMQPTGPELKLTQDEMFHIRGLSSDGVKGRSVIEDYAFQTMGLAIATQEYGARFYANDATPSGVLTTPNKLEDKARDNIVKSWKANHGGRNANGTALLEQDLKFQPIAITNRDAQLLESRKFQVADVARVFGVPSHKIGDYEHATFSNIEQLNIEFATDCIRPWCVAWEQRIVRDLLLETEREIYSVEFKLQGLQRGDMLSRFEAYQIGLQTQVYTPNEVRDFEGLNPRDGGDDPLPLPNASVGTGPTPGDAPVQPGKKPKKSKKIKPAGAERLDFSVDGAGEVV